MPPLFLIECVCVCVCVCVCAQNLEFITAVVSMKGFFEVRFEENPPFELILSDSSWSATIREGNQWTQRELFCGLHRQTDDPFYVLNSRGLEDHTRRSKQR